MLAMGEYQHLIKIKEGIPRVQVGRGWVRIKVQYAFKLKDCPYTPGGNTCNIWIQRPP